MLYCLEVERNSIHGELQAACVKLTLDSLEGLRSDSLILFLQESLEPLPCRVDFLDPEEILYPFDCVAMSKSIRQ